MQYICTECGRVLEEDERAVWYEDRGEHFGTPCSERMEGCPYCYGVVEEYEEDESDVGEEP